MNLMRKNLNSHQNQKKKVIKKSPNQSLSMYLHVCIYFVYPHIFSAILLYLLKHYFIQLARPKFELSEFRREIFMICCIVAYLINYLIGREKNEKVAKKWYFILFLCCLKLFLNFS